MSEVEKFAAEVRENIRRLGAARDLPKQSLDWMLAVGLEGQYTYNFAWMGRPVIQYPQDLVGMQELIWSIRPDLIVETGIAHGGSLVFSASMLALLDLADAIEAGTTLNPRVSRRSVLGIDIDIRPHNRAEIESNPMASRIRMLQGSSIDAQMVRDVHEIARGYKTVLVCLDSNHTHAHVLAELEAYAPLVSAGSYCVVFDTLVEDMPPELFGNRPWGPGNSPKTAVLEFLRGHPEFEVDTSIQHKLQITVAPDGFLRRKA